MSATVLRAIDEDIQIRKNAVEQFNASIQNELNVIEQLKASIQLELNAIQDLETARKTFIKVMPVIVPAVKPSAHVVQVIEEPSAPVETVDVKSIVPVVQFIEEPIAPEVPVIKTTKKIIVSQDSLSPDDYLSVDKKRSVLSNDKKLTDTDFDIYQQFDAKCIHKEKGKAKYNLYYEGQLLHWIDEKGEYNSTYMSGSYLTPFGPHNDDPFKAYLFGRTNQRVKGVIYFRDQSEQISKKNYAKNSEQTTAKTSVKNSEQISKIDMDNKKEFPSL